MFMLGFSYYLNDPIDTKAQMYFQQMADHGFEEVFTSLHIPEDDPQVKTKRMQQLMQLAENDGLSVVVDVDKDSLKYLPHNLTAKLTLRLDDGFSPEDIRDISQEMPIALNASTINKDLYSQLHEYQVDFSRIEAWHNFYPRPETGLGIDWFAKRNRWLKSLGFKTQAFIPGDQHLRGPLKLGLPTLESQRNKNPLANTIQLLELGTDKVFIGDPGLSTSMQHKFKQYFVQHCLVLDYQAFDETVLSELPDILHNRLDPALDVIRIVEGRQRRVPNIPAQNNVERSIGAITVDNELYGRYMGELQIVKTNLPGDEKVNVIGSITKTDQSLLQYVGAGQKIFLNKLSGGNDGSI